MARSTSAARDLISDEDFDPPTQLAILRRAVAGIDLPGSALPARLSAARAELARLCALSQVVLGLLGEAELLAKVCRLAARVKTGPPKRSALEVQRRRLHGWLVRVAQSLAASDESAVPPRGPEHDLDHALAVRRLISDFHGALLSSTDPSNLVWALLVADAELALLLSHPALARGPELERAELSMLHARTRRWRAGKRDAASASRLYGEIVRSSSLLGALSQRREVRRHDERALRELSALLSCKSPNFLLAIHAADQLSALRGLDAELDRLIVDLPLDPLPALAGISRRIRHLRARPLPS